jgi:surfeit locus 1 family protein
VNARTRWVLITLATLLGIAAAVSLGRWQLNRAAQKEALQASMDAHSGQHRVDAAALLAAPDAAALVHQQAWLRGQWLADQTVYLDNRQLHGKVGFFAVTPLKLEGTGQVVLVQRGWVARNFLQREQVPAIDTPPGAVTIEGRIAPPPGKLFELGQPATGAIRQNLNLQQVQLHIGAPVLPVIVVQTGAASEGLLRDWPAINLGVEKHYGYALQWFGIAALQALLYLWFQIVKPRTPRYRLHKDSKPHD